MGSPNYFPGTLGMTTQDRSKLLMQRMRDVISGAELIRQECNRIRNEMLTLGVEPDEHILSLLSHLQIDLVHLRVKYGRMTGLKGEELNQLLAQLANPAVRMDNEDPA